MRNLRQRLTGIAAAVITAIILGSASPALAADGPTNMGGSSHDTCAFVAGKLYKVPPTSGAYVVFMAVLSLLDCD